MKMQLNTIIFLGSVFVISLTNLVSCNHHRYVDMKQESFPHLVLIGYETTYGVIWACSGTLIDQRKIITSSSCIYPKPLGNPKIARISNKELEILYFETADEISVLFLEHPHNIQDAACLSESISSSAMIAGWGGLSHENQLHGTINIEYSITEANIVERSEYTLKVRSSQESICIVDNGGPIQIISVEQGCRYNVFGILKEWKHCGEENSLGEYIKLGPYISWIKDL